MGAVAEKNRCVPRRPQPDPRFEPPRAESLRGNLDPLGRSYEVGIGVTQTILDHFFWAFFTSGSLCLAINSDSIDGLDANIIGALMPGLRPLLEGPPDDRTPAWSPDGTMIAFERDGALYVMDADGLNVRPLIETVGAHPDGDREGLARGDLSGDIDPVDGHVSGAGA